MAGRLMVASEVCSNVTRDGTDGLIEGEGGAATEKGKGTCVAAYAYGCMPYTRAYQFAPMITTNVMQVKCS
jgi:hypothetical protein